MDTWRFNKKTKSVFKLPWSRGFFLACALALGGGSAAQATTTFTFTLPATYTTSAGAYKPDGTLVRTLWRKQTLAAGNYTKTWDDNDDSGNPLPAGTYQVRVLYHNLSYVWEGVIGNTSSAFAGSHVYRGYLPINDMAFDNANAIIARGYMEGQTCLQRFTIGAPQVPTNNPHHDGFSAFPYVATDGTWYYAANAGGAFGGEATTFVTAFNVSDNSQANFTNGVYVCLNGYGSYCYPDQTWPNVIDLSQSATGTNNPNKPTGIAVQTSGNLLAVSHGYLNQVLLFDKRAGNQVGSISVTSPGRVAFAPNGDLWVITGTSIKRYTGLPASPTVAATITGFAQPLGVAVHPFNNDIVLVTDGGTSQQVKAFNSMGTSLWTYGQAGGYQTNGPAVTNDKFWFTSADGSTSYVAVQPDGSFWVGDPGNQRNLHFSSARAYIEQIAFLAGYYYSSAVDINDPTKVVGANWLEYKVDYTQPLVPGDPSALPGTPVWALKYNWAAGVNTSTYQQISTVATLSNARTYALLRTNNGSWQVAELMTSGTRVTSINLPSNYDLAPNGALRYSTVSGGVITWFQRPLTGFDASNNPQWGAASAFASAPAGTNDPWPHGSGGDQSGISRYPITTSNQLITYNNNSNAGNHYGGVKLGASNWLWESGPTGWLDGLGTFQTQQIDGSTQYPGNHAGVDGKNIIYGANGEFYTDLTTSQVGQANQFMHVWDDGLFVGQFGVVGIIASQPNGDLTQAVAGAAGNDFYPSVTDVGGSTYLWHNDESNHGGVHRWRLDGTVQELNASGTKGGTISLGTAGAWPKSNRVFNPGFEQDEQTSPVVSPPLSGNSPLLPSGWQLAVGSTSGSFYTETANDSHSYPYHGTVTGTAAYTSNPYQVLANIPNGTYTLSAWIKSTGGQSSALLYCKKVPGSGTVDYSVNIPTASAWTQISIPSIAITGGQAEIGVSTTASANQAIYFDDVSFVQTSAAPPAPTGLTATAGNASVALAWTAAPGAVSYNVYRGTTIGGESVTATATGITGTTYSNTGLTNGTTYYYIVKAVNANGTGSASNEASATPTSTPPAAPTNLTATAGYLQTNLLWIASPGATSYNIYRGTTAGGESPTPIATGVTAAPYADTGLTYGTTYYYKVAAVNANGTGSYSNEALATPSNLINDTDPGIAYTGSWSYSSGRGLGDYQDDVHATGSTGDTLSYTFTGTGVDYVTEKNNDEGNVDVYIDNILQTTVSCYAVSRSVQQTVYSKTGLTSGSHTIKLVMTGGSYMIIDALRITTGGAAAVAAPAFSPVAGTYTGTQSVTISSATAGASIRYTTDGSTPTSTTGTVYSAPVSISVSGTLKAIAYKSGMTNSSVTSGTYVIQAMVNDNAAGITYTGSWGYSSGRGYGDYLDDVHYTSTYNDSLSYTFTGTAIDFITEKNNDEGNIEIYIDSVLQTTLSCYSATRLAQQTVYSATGLTAGSHTIQVVNRDGLYMLPDAFKVTTAALATVAAPAFSPAAGTYASAQSVTITSATSGASIRYTTNGTTPTSTTGTVYSGPISISTTSTLKAIAYKSGMADSAVTSGTYTISLPVAAPTFSPAAGTYTGTQTVTISSATSGASIRYTTNGTTPTSTTGTVYSAPVSIAVSSTLKAIAYKSGMTDSTVTSGAYVIKTMVNDNAAGITYTGSWGYSSGRGLGDYLDDVHYTNTYNDYLTYTFTGTGVDFITEKNNDEGNIDIYIDSVLQTTLSCYSATRLVQQTVYSATGLAAGSHTIKVVNRDGLYMLPDAFKITP